MTTHDLIFRWAALAGLLSIGAAPGQPAPVIRQVLVLQSFDRGNVVVDHFTANFRVDLDERAGRPVNVVQVVVGPIGSVGASEQATVDYIQSTFSDRTRPDLIVTVAGPATVFARKHRQELFPDTPLLFAAVDEHFLRGAPLADNETAVATSNDYPRIVDGILQVLPRTRQVFMVMGSGALGKYWHRALEIEFERFRGRVAFIWSNDLSLTEMLRRCASLPADSAIFYFTFGTDAAGAAYADERVLADLRARSNAPLFGVQSVYLGAGVVGGTLMSIDDLSRNTADAAIRLLNGATPESIRVPLQSPGQPIYDWRELERWGIPESRLPPGSAVRYRTPSVWSTNRGTVLTAAGVLAIQSLLIAGLLYQRRARRRAEMDGRRNLALAADVSRRQTMSVLTSSIAHELGQPLSSMIYNTHALQTMVSDNRATTESINEILSDIQAQGLRATRIIERNRTMLRNHPIDRKPIDLHTVIDESLALVAHEMDARQVAATLVRSSVPCLVRGDQVLLQQVLVNLMMNGMDAMAATPVPNRRLTIRSDIGPADVEVSVRDNGTGVPPDVIDKLFSPFMTTKSLGLGIGLTIVRKILDAHGGTIAARNNPEGGATFSVTLPRSQPAAE